MIATSMASSSTARTGYALLFAALFALPMLADCGGGASCEAVCDNVLDKCTADSNDLARNQCLEECAQRSSAVPDSCLLESEDVLACLSSADSLDCGDPQQSAACTSENQKLSSCAFGGGGGGGGSGGSTASGGQACQDDEECATGLCNWALDVCTPIGEQGAACGRDDECVGGLVCSWVSDVCIAPAAAGAACQRDEECLSDQCPNDTCQ